MAAGTITFYQTTSEYIADGTIDLDTDTFKNALVLSTSNFATLTLNEYGDLTNEHASNNGYTTGGVTLTGVTWIQASGTSVFTSASAQWTASGGSIVARAHVIYKSGTVGGIVNPLVGYALLDSTPADVTATAGQPFIVTPHATNGWFRLGTGTIT